MTTLDDLKTANKYDQIPEQIPHFVAHVKMESYILIENPL